MRSTCIIIYSNPARRNGLRHEMLAAAGDDDDAIKR